MRGRRTDEGLMEMFTWTVTLHTLRLDAFRITNFDGAVTLAITRLTLTIPNLSFTFAISAFTVFVPFSIAVSVSVTRIIGIVVGPGTGSGEYTRDGCWGCRRTGWAYGSGTDSRVGRRICRDTLASGMKFGTQPREFFFVLLSYFSMLGFELIKGLADNV